MPGIAAPRTGPNTAMVYLVCRNDMRGNLYQAPADARAVDGPSQPAAILFVRHRADQVFKVSEHGQACGLRSSFWRVHIIMMYPLPSWPSPIRVL